MSATQRQGEIKDAHQKPSETHPKAASSPAELHLHKDAYSGSGSESLKTGDPTRGASVMSAAEREARFFLGQSTLSLPNEQGLQSQTAGPNGSQLKYRPEERPDRLERASQSRIDGVDRVSKDYKGRDDGLLSEVSTSSTDKRTLERQFEKGRGPNGLTSDRWEKGGNLESYRAQYAPGKNPDGMIDLAETTSGSTRRESSNFAGRADGLKSFSLANNGRSEKTESIYEPGRGQDGITHEQTWKSVDGGQQGFDRQYDAKRNPDGLVSDTYNQRGNNSERVRGFQGRPDGLLTEMSQSDGSTTVTNRGFADKSTELVTKGPDGAEHSVRTLNDGS